MKTLSTEDIEFLLGVRPSELHPLVVLGYDFTSKGVKRYQDERPDFVPQIFSHIQNTLRTDGIFPPGTDPRNAGGNAYILREGDSFTVSRMEEFSFSRFERVPSQPMSEAAAIHEYIRHVANSDYVQIKNTQK